jgi:hypothetical protein
MLHMFLNGKEGSRSGRLPSRPKRCSGGWGIGTCSGEVEDDSSTSDAFARIGQDMVNERLSGYKCFV